MHNNAQGRSSQQGLESLAPARRHYLGNKGCPRGLNGTQGDNKATTTKGSGAHLPQVGGKALGGMTSMPQVLLALRNLTRDWAHPPPGIRRTQSCGAPRPQLSQLRPRQRKEGRINRYHRLGASPKLPAWLALVLAVGRQLHQRMPQIPLPYQTPACAMPVQCSKVVLSLPPPYSSTTLIKSRLQACMPTSIHAMGTGAQAASHVQPTTCSVAGAENRKKKLIMLQA
jgi:hypothetical protein